MPSLTMEMTYDDLMPEDLTISAWSHVLSYPSSAASWQSKPQRVATDSPVYPFRVRKVQCFCWLSYSNTSYSCTIMHHHAPFMFSSTALECDQKAQQNVAGRIYSSHIKNSWPDANTFLAYVGIQNCRPMNVPKNLDSDHYTTAKKRRSRKSNPGPATWGLTSSRICMSRQTRAQATASAWLTTTLRQDLKQVCFSGPSLNRCHFRQQLPLWDPSEHPSHPKSLSEHGKSPPGNCQGLECHLVTLSGSFTSNGWKTHRGTGFLDVSVSAKTIKDLRIG